MHEVGRSGRAIDGAVRPFATRHAFAPCAGILHEVGALIAAGSIKGERSRIGVSRS
jgi:hypothetical protein